MNLNKYKIEELKNKWKISKEDGKVTLVYEVSKELCGTREEVMKYIKENMERS